jgi:RNA polymerase sigma factor (sigma-70 family)
LAETDRRIRVVSRVLPHVPQRFVSDERLVVLMRRGERGAFESLYDRHVVELLSFCFFMLGSREDAEDAVQSTFTSAYHALLRDQRSVDVRPWLYAIARNACIGILRKRRPQELEQAARPAGEDVFAKVERRESVRQLLSGMLELPERHRTALVLAELHGQSQSEIGELLGVPPSTVKSYIFQARATLTSERAARETDCREIRAELVTARGAALLRGRLRRHLRSCAGCREYAHDVSHRRRELGALLPLLPTLALKRRVLDASTGQAAGAGVCVSGAGVTLSGAIELGGAGAKTLLAKVLIAATGLGAGASAGTLALGVASSQPVAPGARLALASDPAHGQAAHASNGSGSALPGSAGATPPRAPSSVPVAARPAHRGEPTGSGGAAQAGRPHAVAAGYGGAGAGNDGKGKGKGKGDGNSSGNAHGAKANGSSAEHANNAGAHGAAKGKSAEHGRSAERGNSASHRGSGGHGQSGSHGNSQSHGNSSAKNSQAANGNANGVGRANSVAGSGGAAQGHTVGQSHGAAAGASSAAGGAGNAQGQGGSSAGGSAAQAKGNSQPPGQPATVEERTNAPLVEAKPTPGPSAEHGAAGAAGHEPPAHGVSRA